jgi:glycosyltransferase involved in cell wall biosynthesis
MRIGFVVNQLALGGAERQLVDVACGLAARGHECTVFTFYGKTHHREQLQAAGVETIELKAGRRYWPGILPLRRELRRRRIDVVNTHTPLAGTFGRVAGVLARVPVVSTEQRGGPWLPWKVRFLNDVTLNLAHTIVCISGEVRRTLYRRTNWYLRPRGNAVVIYNTVDLAAADRALATDRRAKRAELGLAADDLVLVNVGRYEDEKGLPYLLRMLAQVPRAKLVLVGWGRREADLRREADELGIADRVVFAVERTDALEIVAASDIFLFPSNCEGMGIALVEAMAMEKPVVASRIAPLTEVARDGVDGLLVPPRNPEALVDAVERLGDPELAQRLARSARRRVEEMFALDTAVEAYERVLSAARAAPGAAYKPHSNATP